jgi:hypothetical protein
MVDNNQDRRNLIFRSFIISPSTILILGWCCMIKWAFFWVDINQENYSKQRSNFSSAFLTNNTVRQTKNNIKRLMFYSNFKPSSKHQNGIISPVQHIGFFSDFRFLDVRKTKTAEKSYMLHWTYFSILMLWTWFRPWIIIDYKGV